MAPDVEVPVAAVVDEALGGDGAFSGLVTRTAVVEDAQLPALQDGAGDLAEVFHIGGTGGHLQDADAASDVGVSAMAMGKQVLQAFLEGGDVRGEDAGLEFVEELLRGQQGVEFFGVEPEARQFIERLTGGVVLVAFAIGIVDQRRAEGVAQLVDGASCGGFGAVQFGLYGFQCDGASTVCEQLVQFEDAVEFIHRMSLSCLCLPVNKPSTAS